MSDSPALKQCEIFTRRRKPSSNPAPSKNTSVSSANAKATSSSDATKMASIEEVLSELRSLRADFGGRLDGIDQKLSSMSTTLTVLESGLAATKQDVVANAARIEEAEARIAAAETTQEETNTDLKSALSRISFLEAKTEDLENRGRRKNLRIFGLREGIEGRKPLIEYVTEMLPTWLGLPQEKVFTLERVHRTLATGRPGQNRAVLVRFLKFQEKEFVLREAKRKHQILYEGQRITFAQDLSAETVRARKGFHPVIKGFIDINAFRGFQYNPCKLRILHGGKIHLFSKPQEAEEFYNQLQRLSALPHSAPS